MKIFRRIDDPIFKRKKNFTILYAIITLAFFTAYRMFGTSYPNAEDILMFATIGAAAFAFAYGWESLKRAEEYQQAEFNDNLFLAVESEAVK